MKKDKSKDGKSKKSKDKADDAKSDKSKSKSKSKPKDQDKKEKDSKSPSKKQAKSKKAGDQSEISSISPSPAPPALCVHHNRPFIGYCQTCQELVCDHCTVFGPHNNHLHRILKIEDAYRLRKFYLVEAIRSNLVDKRDKIIAQLHRLEYRVQEIRFVKNIIQRDIRSQYSGIQQRLRNFEGVKLATLTHEASQVQRQLDTINQLGNQFFELTNMECDKLEQERRMNRFLLRSKNMYEEVQYIVNRPDRIPPQLNLQDIPRQVQVNRDTVKKALAGRQINNFKNQIIWKLVTDLRAQQNSIRRQVEEKVSGELKQLSQEVQTSNQRLQSKKMICFFCGNPLKPDTVNVPCQANTSKGEVSAKSHLAGVPGQKHIGNGRHFFVRQISS